MPRKTPEALLGQARVLADAAAAAARWFKSPDPAALAAVKTARLRAQGWRERAVDSLKRGRGPAKADAAELSFSLREAVEGVARAAADAARWELPADPELAEAAAALRDGAKALAQAAEAAGPARAEFLAQAKRWAADAERRRRATRAAAHDSPFFTQSLQRAELASLLSSAAEGLQQACDALAGSLAE